MTAGNSGDPGDLRGLFYSWGTFFVALFFWGDLRGLSGTIFPGDLRGLEGTLWTPLQLVDSFSLDSVLGGSQGTSGDSGDFRGLQGTSGDLRGSQGTQGTQWTLGGLFLPRDLRGLGETPLQLGDSFLLDSVLGDLRGLRGHQGSSGYLRGPRGPRGLQGTLL